MFGRKRLIVLAVFFFTAMAACATTMSVSPTLAGHKQDNRQQFARNNALPDANQAKPPDKDQAPIGQKTRQEFAFAMSKIKVGMAEKEVLDLLGKPDDVRTKFDAGGIITSRTKEIWRYGTDGHLTFPTFGCVYIDNDGKAQYVFGGGGKPTDPKLLSEMELRSLLRLIDKAPSYHSGYGYDPLAVIRIVNSLQPLGKDRALAAIDEYVRVSSVFHSSGRDGVFLVLRVLFDVPADPGYMPTMGVGMPLLGAPKDAKRLPRFPIMVQDDVPVLLATGYILSGRAEPPERHVTYFREHGRLRDKPLVPGNVPLGLLDSWTKNANWPFANDEASEVKLLLANQLLNMVDSVYRRETDANGYKFRAKNDVDGEWKSIVAEVGKLDIRWSPEKMRFTFKNGSHLPEPISVLYRRHFWKLDGMNGEASLVLERIDKKHVAVLLEWSGKKDREMPAFVLDLFAVKDMANKLAESRSTSISGSGGEEVFFSQSFQVDLADGEEIQARLKIGKREQVSPTYKP